ncbi:hypothetical protein ARMSODRAFT_953865 [Armillaria solidipes]|uniref:Pentacotripeptide-repeat region of PRORP domain-containing protein n=1 Tax=Armillaria solidipes TaxID=1076256 RepID=A0A2H3BMS7_9AGAR|nr:hypothetical protein ARMSODRAFT_953865 [Armillaria solidipes]
MIRRGLYVGRWAQEPIFTRTFTSTIAQWKGGKGSHQKLLDSLSNLSSLLSSSAHGDDKVQRFVQRKLDHRDAYASSRDIVFQKILTLLVQHRSWDVGISVYNRMKAEKLQVSEHLTVCFTVAKWLALPPPKQKKRLLAFHQIFAASSFEEKQLLDLLDAFDWSSHAAAGVQLVKVFIESKGEGYIPSTVVVNRLVNLQTRAGDLDGAFESLRKLRPDNGEDTLWPFVSVIARMSDTGTNDKTSLEEVMNLMKERDIGADTSVFNVLIAREIKLGMYWIYPRVLSYYEVLRNLHAATGIGPDVYTFQHLCTTMGRYYEPNRNGWVPGKDQFTPRHLYRDMVAIHFNTEESKTSSIDMSELYKDQKLLNSMLFMFLALDDHVGALVSLRGFTKFGIPVNAKTFEHVVEHLARKIHHNKQKWMPVFLGGPKLDENMELMDPRLLTLLLASMRRNRQGLGRCVVPTLDMINEKTEVPSSARLDLAPLGDALLQVAYNAKGERTRDSDQAIKREVSEAATLMFPEVPTKNYQCGPRRPRRK